ncbi:hypothetical protein [Hwangdonia seohaensis]|uniref:Uncharacterized protein n=1 Tax=Hwangdonia seohaensis TaxID=1240727 RepID=A0ABW3RFJ0_9FLAO|nr:hypothetical protein [Hwangdonia seohaensis]
MSLKKTVEDWKRQNNDPLGYWLSQLDENQLKLMEEVKNRFNSRIDWFSELTLQELRCKIDMHISYEAKRQVLNKIHSKIIDKEEFIPRFRDIINRDDYGLINEELYPEFIFDKQVIGLSSPWVFEENEIIAIEYLENVIVVNAVERLLDILKDEEINGDTRFMDLPKWKKVLLKLGNRFTYREGKYPTAKYSIIHIWMNDNKLLNEVTFNDYRQFLKVNFKEELVDYEFTRLDKNIERSSAQYTNNEKELSFIYNNK